MAPMLFVAALDGAIGGGVWCGRMPATSLGENSQTSAAHADAANSDATHPFQYDSIMNHNSPCRDSQFLIAIGFTTPQWAAEDSADFGVDRRADAGMFALPFRWSR
jgi:hypothetical protein